MAKWNEILVAAAGAGLQTGLGLPAAPAPAQPLPPATVVIGVSPWWRIATVTLVGGALILYAARKFKPKSRHARNRRG